MNKTQFINKVKQGLDNIPKEEQENALRYYVEYFQDAGVENEEDVIKELGTPEEVVMKIKGEMKELKNIEKSSSYKKTEPAVIALLVLASPLILTGILLIASLLLLIFSLLFGFTIASCAFIFAGLICSVVSFFALTTSFSSFLFMLGIGLILISGGLILGLSCGIITKKMGDFIVYIVKKIWKGIRR